MSRADHDPQVQEIFDHAVPPPPAGWLEAREARMAAARARAEAELCEQATELDAPPAPPELDAPTPREPVAFVEPPVEASPPRGSRLPMGWLAVAAVGTLLWLLAPGSPPPASPAPPPEPAKAVVAAPPVAPPPEPPPVAPPAPAVRERAPARAEAPVAAPPSPPPAAVNAPVARVDLTRAETIKALSPTGSERSPILQLQRPEVPRRGSDVGFVVDVAAPTELTLCVSGPEEGTLWRGRVPEGRTVLGEGHTARRFVFEQTGSYIFSLLQGDEPGCAGAAVHQAVDVAP